MKRLIFYVLSMSLVFSLLCINVILISMGIGHLLPLSRVVAIPAYDDRFLDTRLVLLDESRMVKLNFYLAGRVQRLLWSPSGDELMLMTLTNSGTTPRRYFYFLRDGRVYSTPRLWTHPHPQNFMQIVVDFTYLPDGGFLTFERHLDDTPASSNFGMYRTYPNGTSEFLLTLDDSSDPIPSADGRWLAFRGTTAQGTLVLFDTYVLNLETLITQPIHPDGPTGLYEVSWSPVAGDNRLTYTIVQRGYIRTIVYDVDSASEYPLWQDYSRDYRNADWSQDARHILFATGFGNQMYMVEMPNPNDSAARPREPRLIETGYPFNEMLDWLPVPLDDNEVADNEITQISYAAVSAADKVYVVHDVAKGVQQVIFEGYWEVPPAWRPLQ